MSKPEIAVQLVQSEESGKHRVLVTVHKDDWLDLSFVLNSRRSHDKPAGDRSFSQAGAQREHSDRAVHLPRL
jgi:hypothetical protein